jgi:HD-GYP domain-containing protein (c-di-GMP phosphodiesterase class II)
MHESSYEDQEQLAVTVRRRAGHRITRRELVLELCAGLGLVGAAAALCWANLGGGSVSVVSIASLVVLVLATRVQFETPFGFTVASQLAFVPLVFWMPSALIVPAVVVALCVACLPEVMAGEDRLGGLLRTPANAWFAVGPVLVFTVAGVAPREAGPAVLAAALAAQFAVDFGISALRFGYGRRASIASQLRELWVYGVDAALSGVGLVVAEQMHRSSLALLAIVPLLGVLAMFAREREGRLRNLAELNETYRGTAKLLGDVISADDDYTGAHSQGVVGLARWVGETLGLDAERRRNLEFAAQLHDLGKISIPKEIINKPGALDPDEWEMIKTHTVAGENMLSRVGGFMCDVGAIVRAHHERWDGQGYPDGVAGMAVPIEARIITACDSWSAMRTDRPYRRALSHEVAVAEMHANTGTQFDPRVVRALLEVVDQPVVRPVGPLERPVLPVADHEPVIGSVEAEHRGERDVTRDPQLVPQAAAAQLGGRSARE